MDSVVVSVNALTVKLMCIYNVYNQREGIPVNVHELIDYIIYMKGKSTPHALSAVRIKCTLLRAGEIYAVPIFVF